MDKNEILTNSSLRSGKEKPAATDTEAVYEDESLAVKFVMAHELKKLGLSDEAISRQLNINYRRR